MGRDLVIAYPSASEIFSKADDILGFSLSQLCFNGPPETLTQTSNAQPAVLTVSLACLQILREKLPGLNPTMVAGHSLGEFTALVASDVMGFEDAVSLVHKRGHLMAEAGERSPGGMAAIIGLDEHEVKTICQEATGSGGIIQISNLNAPGQIVVSGDRSGLETASSLALSRSGTKVIHLAVSVAPHSPLMKSMIKPFHDEVKKVRLGSPKMPVIGNVCGQPLSGPSDILRELELQLTSPVRWVDSIRYMVGEGVTTFIELGPGSVLRGLVRRIDSSLTTASVGDAKGIEALVQDLQGDQL
jgi:[acyl-carrier-protein] S-malonyltransferase